MDDAVRLYQWAKRPFDLLEGFGILAVLVLVGFLGLVDWLNPLDPPWAASNLAYAIGCVLLSWLVRQLLWQFAQPVAATLVTLLFLFAAAAFVYRGTSVLNPDPAVRLDMMQAKKDEAEWREIRFELERRHPNLDYNSGHEIRDNAYWNFVLSRMGRCMRIDNDPRILAMNLPFSPPECDTNWTAALKLEVQGSCTTREGRSYFCCVSGDTKRVSFRGNPELFVLDELREHRYWKEGKQIVVVHRPYFFNCPFPANKSRSER